MVLKKVVYPGVFTSQNAHSMDRDAALDYLEMD